MARVQLNPGIGKYLEGTPEMKRAMVVNAGSIATTFAATAPRDTGTFASSAAVSVTGRGARVELTDPAAVHKEFGTRDTPAFGSLRRAVRAAGFRLGRRRR